MNSITDLKAIKANSWYWQSHTLSDGSRGDPSLPFLAFADDWPSMVLLGLVDA